MSQYVTSVYTTTPLSQRADALLNAMEPANGVSALLNPIKEMEDVSAGSLPDLSTFLPLWVKRLGRVRQSKDEWESEHTRRSAFKQELTHAFVSLGVSPV
ncbi:MAG TPA: hypothetical protein VI485_15780 [Vicinamibacterales bacterium]|nr:hypothetical protein [Vicinamibacterales bacterium]